jgi:hypothetical protein
MSKTFAYYLEKYLGFLIGTAGSLFVYNNWTLCSFMCTSNFFDKVITISTTLFGFLLTVLTLIVQSTSEVILSMKKHGSYKRLILFNKNIVLLSAIVCILSLVLNSTTQKIGIDISVGIKIVSLINFSLFLWAVVDTFIFVFIFYKLLISETGA